jgi:hypothetical protein
VNETKIITIPTTPTKSPSRARRKRVSKDGELPSSPPPAQAGGSEPPFVPEFVAGSPIEIVGL